MKVDKLKKILFKFKDRISLILIRLIGILGLFTSFKLINLNFGESFFGLFSLIIVFTQIASLFISFGIPIHTMKEISKINNDLRCGDFSKDLINKSFNTLFKQSIIFVILTSIFYITFHDYFTTERNVGLNVFLSILLIVPFHSLTVLNGQILRSFNLHKDFQWFNMNLFYLFFSLFLVVGVYLFSISSNMVFIGYLMSILIIFIVSYLRLPIKYSLKLTEHNSYFKTLKTGFDFFASQFLTQGFSWLTIVFTAYFINEIDAGGLNIIIRYLSLTTLFIMITNTRKGTDYTFLFHKGEIKKLNADIFSNTRFMFVLTIPIIVVMFIFPDFFLRIFSDEYLHLKNVFRLMLVGYFVNLCCGSVGMLMQMTNQQKMYRNIMFLALIIHGVLGYFLTKEIGVLGLGISLFVALVFWNIVSAIILRKKYKIISYINFK